MSAPLQPHSRHHLAGRPVTLTATLTLALALALALAGCGAGAAAADRDHTAIAEPRDGGNAPSGDLPPLVPPRPASLAGQPILSLVVTAASSEPRPRLPPSLRGELARAASASRRPGGAVVTVSVPGRPVAVLDLTPLRGDRVENVARKRASAVGRNLDHLESVVRGSSAAVPGLNTLAAADQAARGNGGAPLAVLSSGVSTGEPLDLRKWSWPENPASVGAFLAAHDLLPAHLAARAVRFYFLGDVGGRQPELMTPARQLLNRIYLDICRRARAADCRVAEDPPTGDVSLATPAVPLVEVPAWPSPELPDGRSCTAVVNLPTPLLFGPDEAALTGEARARLRPFADRLIAAGGDVVITLIRGHTADAGPGDGIALSRSRAEAVAAALVALGVRRAWIRRVDGVGETEQRAPDRNPDGTPGPGAALNRRVEIRTQRACTAP